MSTSGENIKQSSTQMILLLPYMLLWIQAIGWACWAFLDQHDEIFRLQFSAVIVYGFYCGAFCMYAEEKQKSYIRAAMIGSAIVSGAFSFRALAVMDPASASVTLSYTALIFNVILYTVPFLQLSEVMATGRIEIFPLPLCATSLLSSMLWSVHSW